MNFTWLSNLEGEKAKTEERKEEKRERRLAESMCRERRRLADSPPRELPTTPHVIDRLPLEARS